MDLFALVFCPEAFRKSAALLQRQREPRPRERGQRSSLRCRSGSKRVVPGRRAIGFRGRSKEDRRNATRSASQRHCQDVHWSLCVSRGWRWGGTRGRIRRRGNTANCGVCALSSGVADPAAHRYSKVSRRGDSLLRAQEKPRRRVCQQSRSFCAMLSARCF